MTISTRIVPAAMLLLALAGVGAAESGKALRVVDAWIREAPPLSTVLAGYVRIENESGADVEVVGAHSPLFGRIEFHETQHHGSVAHMTAMPRIRIAAGATVTFEPGGLHLMLMMPARPLVAGDRVPVTLALDGGATLVMEMVVRRQG